MSVSTFSADELANVAVYLCSGRYGNHKALKSTIQALAAFSVANAWAFNTQYNDDMKPVTYEEILDSATTRVDVERAMSSIRLLSYNAVTNNGDEAATPGFHEAMHLILSAAFSKAHDALGDLRRAA